MARQNTHRADGRAVTPLASSHRAARGLGGSAVLGAVLVGTAFTGGSAAMANDQGLAGGDEAPSTSRSAPVQESSDAAQETLRQGDSGEAVEALQAALNADGADLPETGYFGSMTHDAVTSFQAEQGLEIDGVVGTETHGALDGDSSESAAPGGTSAPGATSVPAAEGSSSVVDAARSAIGTPYSWGGASQSGMDCSGLVAYAYEAAGIDVPRTSGAQAEQGRSISEAEAQPGDLVTYPGHIAIYAGDGKIIDASGSQQEVVERDIWGSPTGFVTYR